MSTTTKRGRGRPRSAWSEDQTTTVQALERGLSLLNALARTGRATLTELALSIGMPTASAHRLLATLDKQGFATFDEASQTWSVGVQAFRVGSSFAQQTRLVDVSRKVMRQLMEDTGETANLGIVADLDVVFVSQVETPNPIRAFFPIGARGPIHATGIGKAYLAQMSEAAVVRVLERTGLEPFTANTRVSPSALLEDLEATRARGWSFDDEERFEGMRCVAAALRSQQGDPIGGVSVSGPHSRLPDHRVAEIGARVRRAAEEIHELTGAAEAPASPVDA